MYKNFLNKVVLITGAAAGFGKATAERFSRLGAQLALIDINRKGLQDLEEKYLKVGEEKPLLIEADLSKENDIERIIKETIGRYNKLDILVNNAAIFKAGSMISTNLSQFDEIFDVNCRAVFYLTHLAIPHLRKTNGNIINLSSITSDMFVPGSTVYSLSKGFIDHFTKHTAMELASKGVRVNSVKAGVVHTNIYKSGGLKDENITTILQKAERDSPLQRRGQIEDVAKAITFLASDDANHITGLFMSVDGGMHLKRIFK